MITIHDLMGNGCCTNPYTDFAIVNIKTGEVLVDRVHDKTYTVDDNKDYDQFLAYEGLFWIPHECRRRQSDGVQNRSKRIRILT